MLALLLVCHGAMEVASQCGVIGDKCGEGANRAVHGTMHAGASHTDVLSCCESLLCEEGVCKRPWGTPAPTAEDLVALYTELAPPEKTLPLDVAQKQLENWKGREERLFASIRARFAAASAKARDEL